MLSIPELRVEFAPMPLAAPFLVLLALVAPPVLLSVLRKDRIAQLPLLVLFIATMTGVLFARTVAAFALSWEAMALVSAFLVATHHERRAVRRAAFSYLAVGQIGALCIFAALAILAAHAQSVAFGDIARSAPSLPADLRTAVLLLALVGFGSKAGLVPLHFWLPRAHPVAPSAASALLSGVMLKIAIYGLLLVCFSLAAPVSAAIAGVILSVGLLSAVAGAVYAALDSDLKRLLAFSSIENIGIITAALGFALLAQALHEPVLAAIALAALVFHVLAHGVFKGLLFLGAGEIASAAHTTDLEHLGGLTTLLRYSAPAILIGCLAAAALPPLSGFASEWVLFQALMQSIAAAPAVLQAAGALSIIALGFASGVAAIAFTKAFGVGALGTPRSAHPRTPERFGLPAVALTWLALLAIALGVGAEFILHPLLGFAAMLVPAAANLTDRIAPVPVWVAALPVAGALASALLVRTLGVKRVPTWTCGSAVTVRSQYSALAFANPLRVLLGVLAHAHVDEAVRSLAAAVQRLARRTRIVQAGYVRIYLAYALAAIIVVLVIAR